MRRRADDVVGRDRLDCDAASVAFSPLAMMIRRGTSACSGITTGALTCAAHDRLEIQVMDRLSVIRMGQLL